MSRSKPVVRRLSELEPGQLADFFALLQERTRGTTRDGKPYWSCRLRDARRTATWMIWADHERFAECDREWKPGLFFKVRATYDEHPHYGPKLEVHNIRPVMEQDRADGFSEAEFVEMSRFDTATMFHDLRALVVEQIQNEPLRRLTLTLLDAHAERLRVLPASPRHYHPFPGGWLEHTLQVTRTCVWLVAQYRTVYPELRPPLNADLVIAGAALHEIGRVMEITPGELPGEPPEPTIPGRLFGHVQLGRDLVRDTARSVEGLDPALLLLLEHLLLSYLTLPEWGSPRLPMIPEALIVHHADDLDAKLEMYTRCLKKDISPGPFTERDPILGKVLLKDRTA